MDKLISAIVEAQKNINNANQTAVNDFFKSSKNRQGSPYATLEDVIQAVKGPLLAQGVLYQQESSHVEGRVCIETVFYGHGAELRTGKIFVPADKMTPHGYGGALTYARRYSLSLATGIGSADDDGNAAESEVKAKAKAKTKTIPATKVTTAKYSFVNATGGILATANDEIKFLELCRSFLKNPDKKACQELFVANENTIRKAEIAAVNDVKKAIKEMLNIYTEGAKDDNE